MMNDGIAPTEETSNTINFTKEIQCMMHAFGDNPFPLQASVNLVETVVYQQMHLLLQKASDVATLRGSTAIDIEELLFLMRKDRIKIQRLLNYLAVKDLKTCFVSNIDGCDNENVLEDPVSPPRRRRRMCLDYLETIDQTGELTAKIYQPFDAVKHERNIRAELMSQQLDENRYIEYSNARRMSFKPTYSRASKLRDWLLSKGDPVPDLPKSSSLAYEILCYLAYETVAEIVDLSLLVRQDAAAKPDDPFSYYIAGFTRMPGYYPPQYTAELPKKQGPPPITPAEIQEALRRYWSPQICPWSPFSRTAPESLSTRLLAC